MTQRRAIRHFKLQHERGRFLAFATGQIIPDEHADHWFVLENTVEVAPAPIAAPIAPRAPVVAPIAKPAPVVAPVVPVAPTAEEVADAALAASGVSKDELLSQAKELGITADGRWGISRLQTEIDKALAK